MGYLVKASFNAEPRAYALEGIRTDVAAKLLPLSAIVRHEKQDFWYSVEELIGESPVTEFQFTCPCCKETTSAREIDVDLEVSCLKCGEIVKVPDILPAAPLTDPTPDLPLLRRGERLLFWGGAIIIGQMLASQYFLGAPCLTQISIIKLVGICMMINGYGKRQLFYLKHPQASPFSVS